MSLKPRHQGLEDGRVSETDCLQKYLNIAKKHELKVTLFLTGKLVVEESGRLKEMIDPERVEVGGHTYAAFRPKIIYGTASRILRLSNGPRFIQKRDIRLTMEIIEKILDTRVVSWRDHAYRHDRNTYELLGGNGIRFVSDEVSVLNADGHFLSDNIYVVPINTTPDHENLPHGGQEAKYSAATWVDQILKEVRHLSEQGAVAVILAHPACMYVEDRFVSFKRLCEGLRKYPSCFMKEVSHA
ncbi:polysaccharide deacetylase family protein [Thermodesulfobacteriota bacterium]